MGFFDFFRSKPKQEGAPQAPFMPQPATGGESIQADPLKDTYEIPDAGTEPRYQAANYAAEPISKGDARELVVPLVGYLHEFDYLDSDARGGMANLAFRARTDKGEFIFRFARHPKANKGLEMETKILPELSKKLHLAIPAPEYSGHYTSASGEDLLFAGYRTIDGAGLSPRIFGELDADAKKVAAEQLGEFFTDLHAFPVARAAELGVPERKLSVLVNERLDARELIFPYIQAAAPAALEPMRDNIERLYSWYFSQAAKHPSKRTLVHGDLEWTHVLYDMRIKKLVGLVDFGAMRIDDPDVDFWRPYQHYGLDFVRVILEHYEGPATKDFSIFERKLQFFWGAQLIHRLVREIQVGDDVSRGFALKRIQEFFDLHSMW